MRHTEGRERRGLIEAMARQIREGFEMETSKNCLMNLKAEWNNARIPRIIIEVGENQTEDKESGLGSKTQERRKIDRAVQVSQRNDKRKAAEEGNRGELFRFIYELITTMTIEFIYGVEGPSPRAVIGVPMHSLDAYVL